MGLTEPEMLIERQMKVLANLPSFKELRIVWLVRFEYRENSVVVLGVFKGLVSPSPSHPFLPAHHRHWLSISQIFQILLETLATSPQHRNGSY
jgi:hypothetical protein